MKTTVFITRRGRSFALAKVNPTSVSPIKSFQESATRKELHEVKVNPTERLQRGKVRKGEFQSGQMGQTVNLLSLDFGGSNPSSPTRQALTMPGDRCLRFFLETTLLI